MRIFTQNKLKNTAALTLSALVSTLAIVSTANADSSVNSRVNTDDSPWYLMAEVGIANSQVSDVDITRLLNQQNAPSTLSVNALDVDSRDAAWSIHVGYEFYHNLSIELGYMDLGNRSVHISGSTTDVSRFYQQVSAIHPEAGEGVSAAFAVRLPVLGDELSLNARLGYFDWEGGYHTRANQQSVGTSRVEGNDVWYGLSLNYKLNQDISGLISYKRVNLSRDDNNVVSIGLVYHF